MLTLLVLPLLGWWLAQYPLPALEGIVTLSDLSEPVTVRFDSRGVPYVDARSDEDMYLAQGYLTARDRLFQMDIMRRTALGELSEVFGSRALSHDKLVRTLGFRQLVEEEVRLLPPEMASSLERYAAGVNSHIRSGRLPLEFWLLNYKPRPWRTSDSLAVLRYLRYTQDESWQLDNLRQRIFDKAGKDDFEKLFGPELDLSRAEDSKNSLWQRLARTFDESHIFGQPGPSIGSTAIAVSGKLSDSGGPVLFSDKHTLFSAPAPWYLSSLASPAVRIAGATIPGVPGIMVGRNQYIAWGSAGLKADVQDLFLEEFDPSFPAKYKTETGWENSHERQETIAVRFAGDLIHKVTTTRHGPLLLRDGKTGVSLSWTGNKANKSQLASLWKLARARNFNEFSTALADYPGPPMAFVFADRSGTIGLRTAGDIPIRQGNGQGTTVVAGWESKGQWIGSIPFADLPQRLNPDEGYLVAANQKLVASDYRFLIGHQWGSPCRAIRASSVLAAFGKEGGRKIGLPDMNALQSDRQACLFSLVRDEIKKCIADTNLIDRLKLAAVNLLDSWDGQLQPDSAASSIYESFLRSLTTRILTARLGPELAAEYVERWPLWSQFAKWCLIEKPRTWLPPEERTYTTFMLTTFSQALQNLRVAFGNEHLNDWAWQRVHDISFSHPVSAGLPWLGKLLGPGVVGVGGDADCLNSCDTGRSEHPGRFPCQSGPTMRFLCDLSDQDKFYQCLCLGQSGQLFSPYQRDQLNAWLNGTPAPVAFSSIEIDRQSQHKLILTNRLPGAP